MQKVQSFGVNLTARKEGKDTPEGNVYVRKVPSTYKMDAGKSWRVCRGHCYIRAINGLIVS